MEKIRILEIYTIELERFLHSGLDAILALCKLGYMIFESLAASAWSVLHIMLGHCVVIFRHSPTKFEYISPTEKRLESNYQTSPPRFFN